MDINTAIQQFMQLQAKLSAYQHAMSLIFYDGVTSAPKATAANRGQTLSVLSAESYMLSTGEETVKLLEYLNAHKDELTDAQNRMVFLALRDIRDMQKIPMDE